MLIYGSRAKGTFREGTDIDISLKDDSILPGLHLEIDYLNTPYFFDILIYHKLISGDLKKYIDKFEHSFI